MHPLDTCLPMVEGSIRSVDLVNGAADVHGACTEWISGTSRHEARKIRPALQHLCRRNPVGPFRLALDRLYAGPGETFAPDANPIADRFAATEHVVEIGVGRIDNDRARRFARRISHNITVSRAGIRADDSSPIPGGSRMAGAKIKLVRLNGEAKLSGWAKADSVLNTLPANVPAARRVIASVLIIVGLPAVNVFLLQEA